MDGAILPLVMRWDDPVEDRQVERRDRPSEVSSDTVVVTAHGEADPAENVGQKRYTDLIGAVDDRVRDRPGGQRQDLSRRGDGDSSAEGRGCVAA